MQSQEQEDDKTIDAPERDITLSSRTQLVAEEDENGAPQPVMVTPAEKLIGTLVADKYRILSVLGQGGMSVVYLARHEALNKLMAVKTLHLHLANRTTSLLRFQQEARAASALCHRGIVGIHDYGVTPDGIPFLAMDYVKGEPLSDLIARVGPLLPGHALEVFVQTAAAMAHAHEKGVIHRDMKPSNIMLEDVENEAIAVKIVDFGVAKFVDDTHETPNKLTLTGESVGSPMFMSPEQCLGQKLDRRSDIYSLGCVMYEALTGVPAFSSDSVFATMFKQMNEMPAPFASVRPDRKFGSLETVVFKCLSKEPDKRYQSMLELERDLERLSKGRRRTWFKKLTDRWYLVEQRSEPRKYLLRTGWSATAALMLLVLISLAISGVGSLIPSRTASLHDVIIWDERYPDPLHVPLNANTRSMLSMNLAQGLLQSAAEPELKKAEGNIVMGGLQRCANQYQDAVTYLQEGIRVLVTTGLPTRHSVSSVERGNVEMVLLKAYYDLGDCFYYLGNYKDAETNYSKKVQMDLYITDTHPAASTLPGARMECRQCLVKLADCFYFQNNPPEALGCLDRVKKEMDLALQGLHSQSVALYWSKFADIEFRTGHIGRAIELYRRSVDEWRSLESGRASDWELTRNRVLAQGCLAEVVAARLMDDRADAAYKEFFDGVNTLNPRLDVPIAGLLDRYASYLWQKHHWVEAIQVAQRAKAFKPAR